MTLKPLTITAPSYWASYLINGDDSGLEPQEKAACDAWLAREAVGLPVSCDDAGFCHRHDAWAEAPYSADCQDYVFLIAA